MGSREIEPTTPPITTLASPTAQSLVHVQPFLLLAYFCLRFPQIVANPVSALYVDLLPIVVIQCTYAVTCLPVSKRGSTVSDPSSRSASASRSKSAKQRGTKASVNPNYTSSATRSIVRKLRSSLKMTTLTATSAECLAVSSSDSCRRRTNIPSSCPIWRPNNYTPSSYISYSWPFCVTGPFPTVLCAWRG